MIPVGPQGPAGTNGATGATGPAGPQGIPGQDAVIEPLNWVGLTLTNDWQDAGGGIAPSYAVSNGLMYLRGVVKNDSYTNLKQVIFTNAPVQTTSVQTMCFELIQSIAAQVQLLPGNSFQYTGPTRATLRIPLDSVPVIRLY